LAAAWIGATPLRASADESLLQSAREQAMVGVFDESERNFRRALEGAAAEPARAQIQIDYADSLSRAAQGRAAEARLREQAGALYEAALPAASGALRVRAANNYGALLVREGKPETAVKVLEGIQGEPSLAADKASHARYLYNLGRAYELAGRSDEARLRYQESALADPTLAAAARAVSRVTAAQAPTPERLSAGASWAETLVERDDLALALDALESAFARPAWRAHDAFPHFMRALMTYLAAAQLPVDTFEQTWESRLRTLPETASGALAIGRETVAIYRADLPVSFDPSVARRLLNNSLTKLPRGTGTPPTPALLSRLLKAIGDAYADAGDLPKSLQRYALGTAVDLHGPNIDASLYAANLLLWNGKELDQSDRHLNELVNRLFDAKGMAYRGENWEDILRFHTVLGSVFLERQVWGSETDPRSAIFQFEHALRADERIRTRTAGAAPVDSLRIRLAKSYGGAERYEDAVRTYIDAGEGGLAQDNVEIVREAIDGAARIQESHSISQQASRRLETLRARAADLTPAAPPPPIDFTEISLAAAANQSLGRTSCFRTTRAYRKIVSDFGSVDADTRVVETERKGRTAPAEVTIDARFDKPGQMLALLCVSHISDEALQEQVEIGKLRFEFASGSPLVMPIANIGSDPAWIRLAPASDDGSRDYLRPLAIPLRKPFSTRELVRVVLIDASRELDGSADPGLTLIKLMVGEKPG
jgi:tetratricopeptide (TPR) repeat protein